MICTPDGATPRGDTQYTGSNKEELDHIRKDFQGGGHNRKGFYNQPNETGPTPLDRYTVII